MRKSHFLLLFLTSCMAGPNYQPPETAVSDTWNAEQQTSSAKPLQKWWEVFHDELLDKYIDLAANNNFDIQTAEANILKARALRQTAASALFPQVNADLSGFKTYFSKNGLLDIGPSTGRPSIFPQMLNFFNALFDASWELDLFGKTRRGVEAAQAQYESAIDSKNDVLISTLAEVARNYIDLRSNQRRAELLKKNINLYERHADIVRTNLQFGYANQLDLETIETQLATARAALPDAYAETYRAIYSLSILIGTPPETLVDELLEERPLPAPPNQVLIGLRSELLRRRPDIRYAERKLAEATANLGVAVASFFPTISLTGIGGLQSLALPKLFEWGSRTWIYGANVTQPVFQGGQLVGQLHFNQADQAMAAAAYQQTVLSALQDAETSLKNYQQQAAATQEYDRAIFHNNYVVALTRERHIKGLINLIDLLNNEKQLIATELTQLDSKTAELTALIALYKSLGGDWDENRINPSGPPAPSGDIVDNAE